MADTLQSVNAEHGRRSTGPQRSKASHSAILEAAEALLVEGGPGAVTFEAVARRAKAGKPTIYRWWPNKTALLLELYDRHKDRVVAAPNLGSFRADLLEITRLLWAFWRDSSGGPAFAAIIAEAQTSAETRQALVTHFADNGRTSLTLLIESAISRGELPQGTDVRTIREAIMAMNWFHLLCGKLDPDIIPDVVGRLIDGLQPRTSPPKP